MDIYKDSIYKEKVSDLPLRAEHTVKDKRQRERILPAKQGNKQADNQTENNDEHVLSPTAADTGAVELASATEPQPQFVERRSGEDRRQSRDKRGRFIDSRLVKDRRKANRERISVEI